MVTICIAGTQTGTGATTTAVTLAHGIALRHIEVVIVDCDPRGHVATLLGLPQTSGLFDWLVSQKPIEEVLRPTETFEYARAHLSFISSDRKTAGIPYVLSADRVRTRLKAGLDQLSADYVIFDTSSAPPGFTEIVMSVADLLIIATRLQPPHFQDVAQTLATLEAVKSRRGHCSLLGILPTLLDGNTATVPALRQLQLKYGGDVLPAIRRSISRLEHCAREGITVWEDDPWSGSADDYTLLVLTVMNHILAYVPADAGGRAPRNKKPERSRATYELPSDLIQRVKKAAWEIAVQFPHEAIWLDDVASSFLQAGLRSYEAGHLTLSLNKEPHAASDE